MTGIVRTAATLAILSTGLNIRAHDEPVFHIRPEGHRARSRGPQAQKKKRPNLNHISKRVRRKHRRAA